MTATATVQWLRSWEGVPIAEPEECRHPGTEALAIGHQLVAADRGGGLRATSRATLCMLCGLDTTGRMTSEDAIEAALVELGWNEAVRLRLFELSDHDAARGAPHWRSLMEEVTGNSQLLLGFIAGSVAIRSEDAMLAYDMEDCDASRDQLILRARSTDNLYRVTVIQVGGER